MRTITNEQRIIIWDIRRRIRVSTYSTVLISKSAGSTRRDWLSLTGLWMVFLVVIFMGIVCEGTGCIWLFCKREREREVLINKSIRRHLLYPKKGIQLPSISSWMILGRFSGADNSSPGREGSESSGCGLFQVLREVEGPGPSASPPSSALRPSKSSKWLKRKKRRMQNEEFSLFKYSALALNKVQMRVMTMSKRRNALALAL